MNPNPHHKTIAYIILGIVVVVALGVYIYLALSNVPTPTYSATTPSNPIGQNGLTPQKIAVKVAEIRRSDGWQGLN